MPTKPGCPSIREKALSSNTFPQRCGEASRSCRVGKPGLQLSFMQNVLMYFVPTIRTQNAFYSSVGDSRTSFIDVRDIAAAIANIFVASGKQSDEHKGKTYELNGPEALTYAEVAEKISRAAGCTIRYVDIPEDAQRQSLLGLGMPIWQVEALLELQQYYRLGVGGGDGGEVLKGLLRRAPRTMDEYLTENKDALGEASAAKV